MPIPHQSAPPAGEPAPLRRGDDHQRFVAFAFAAADMLVETDAAGIITYAAGAFRSVFGNSPESVCRKSMLDLVAPVDRDHVTRALAQLVERGRVMPFTIRMSDQQRTPLAFSGIALPAPGRPLRLCLTFSRPPAPPPGVLRGSAGGSLASAATAYMRDGASGDLSLIEITGGEARAGSPTPTLGRALEKLAPHAMAAELAPGRYGLLLPGGCDCPVDLVAGALEQALRADGIEAAVATCHLPLADEGLTPQQALRALRQALAAFAKQGQKGFADAGFDGGIAGYMQRAGERAASLRMAISGNRFSLAYQPIVSLTDRTCHHVEALIRPLPLAGASLSSPQDFVSMVESLGLADELDIAVCRMACEAAGRARRAVAFNLSGQSIQSPDFRDRLADLLERSAARKSGLIMVEMTETAEVEDLAEAHRTAQMLRALQVPFCLDDFGAGTNDVRLLRALTPDIVKLDGSYVPGVAQGGRERAFIAGMVEIAHAAGAQVVAERIETEAEAGALRAVGVEFGQGWLFGRPGQLSIAPAARRAAQSGVAPADQVT